MVNSDDVFGRVRSGKRRAFKPPKASRFVDADFIDPQGILSPRGRGFNTGNVFERFCRSPVFFKRWALEESDGLNPSLHYAMDYDLWWKMALVGRLIIHMGSIGGIGQ
jgi:hypothetical protein